MRVELRSNFNLARSSLDLARSIVLLAFFLCSGSNFVKASASEPILFSLSRFITFDLISPIERKKKLASVAKRRLTGPARTIKLEVTVGLRNSKGSFFPSQLAGILVGINFLQRRIFPRRLPACLFPSVRSRSSARLSSILKDRTAISHGHTVDHL